MKRNNKKILVWLIGLLTILLFSLAGCSDDIKEPEGMEPFKENFFAMDTMFSITIYSKNASLAAKAGKAAQDEIMRVEKLTNRYEANITEGSIAKINAEAGKSPVKVDKELFDLIALSMEWQKKTEGNFSIVLGPIIDLWKNSGNVPPDEIKINQALAFCKAEDVILDLENSTVFLTKTGMSLDLGAVAKGYALDCAKKKLVDMGIEHALIDGGGSILAVGKNSKNEPWKIGLAHPRTQGSLSSAVEVEDMAVISSGDYQRYFEYNGIRYHHIIHPGTGQPARGYIASSIIAPNAALADILSTALFVGGEDLAKKLGAEYLACLIINENMVATPFGDFEARRAIPYSDDISLK